MLLGALPLAGCDPAADHGRAGNRHLSADRPADAHAAYRSGLARADTGRSRVAMALLNNDGLARLVQDSARAALEAFDAALAVSPDDERAHRAAYHAGLAAAASSDLEGALARFRRALLLGPTAADARYNWEFVARRLRDAQGRAGGGGRGEGGESGKDESDDGDPGSGGGPGERTPDAPPAPAEGAPTNSETAPGDRGADAPSDLSRADAERILDALGGEEARLVRRTVRGTTGASRSGKDW